MEEKIMNETSNEVEAEVTPVVEAEVTPVVEAEVTPVVEAEVTPVVEAEVTSVVEAEVTPVVEVEATPVVEAEVTPVVEETKKENENTQVFTNPFSNSQQTVANPQLGNNPNLAPNPVIIPVGQMNQTQQGFDANSSFVNNNGQPGYNQNQQFGQGQPGFNQNQQFGNGQPSFNQNQQFNNGQPGFNQNQQFGNGQPGFNQNPQNNANQQPLQGVVEGVNEKSSLCTVTLVLGILGIFINPLCGVVIAAFVCGIISLSKKPQPSNRNEAVIGLVLAGVALLVQGGVDLLTGGLGLFC